MSAIWRMMSSLSVVDGACSSSGGGGESDEGVGE